MFVVHKNRGHKPKHTIPGKIRVEIVSLTLTKYSRKKVKKCRLTYIQNKSFFKKGGKFTLLGYYKNNFSQGQVNTEIERFNL